MPVRAREPQCALPRWRAGAASQRALPDLEFAGRRLLLASVASGTTACMYCLDPDDVAWFWERHGREVRQRLTNRGGELVELLS